MTASKHRILPVIYALTAAFVLCCAVVGCQSYQLGHAAELPFETIYIEPVRNESFAPQAQALLSSEVREAVIRDGRVRLVADREEADALLLMTLTDYNRRASARRQDDTRRAQSFDLSMQVQLDLYDQINGDYLFRGRRVEARTQGYVDNPYAADGAPATQGLIQSEFNAMPRLARDLGRRAADEVLGAW